jgi:hypothetical protein
MLEQVGIAEQPSTVGRCSEGLEELHQRIALAVSPVRRPGSECSSS